MTEIYHEFIYKSFVEVSLKTHMKHVLEEWMCLKKSLSSAVFQCINYPCVSTKMLNFFDQGVKLNWILQGVTSFTCCLENKFG